jgi:methyl-accepting chemotaxis protein
MIKLRFTSFTASLRAQFAIAMVLMTLITVIAVAAIGLQRLNSKITEDIESRTLWSLRVAVRVFAEGAPVFQVEKNADGEPERLRLTTASSMLDNFSAGELMKIVDSITEANRGTATYFRWNEQKKDFVRIATTVKKPDGTRAVGTTLGQNGPVYPFMMRADPYRGIANILGEPYQTGYLPIVDAKNNPAGILYIGVGKMTELSAASTAFMRDMIIGCLVVLAIAMLVTFVVTARLLRPLGRVAEATTALANGTEGVAIPHLGRQDEIGVLARAVDGFSEAVSQQRAYEQQNIDETRRVAARSCGNWRQRHFGSRDGDEPVRKLDHRDRSALE